MTTDDSDWMAAGIFGGSLVRSAESRVRAVSADLSLCVAVLDAMSSDGMLKARMEVDELLKDVRYGRLGREWTEERSSIAESTASSFQESWPGMRVRLQEASLVALVSAMDTYAIALFVEFLQVTGTPDDRLWTTVDGLVRGHVKSAQSISGAWHLMSASASLPAQVKSEFGAWRVEYGNAIDEMTLVRNCLVHNAGRVNRRLAEVTGFAVDAQIRLGEQQLTRYRRACWSLTNLIDPPL